MRPEVVRRVAPLAVAAAVLAVVGLAWLAGRAGEPTGGGPGDGGTTGLARLHLSSWIAPGKTVADPRYRLAPDVDFPEGPRQSAVFTVRPQLDRRDALAAALGPVADRLTVQPDGSWGMGGVVCAEPGVTSPTNSVPPARDCPAPAPGGTGDPLAVAQPVLDAAGLGDERADVERPSGAGGTAIVRVDPKVNGLPTDGWSTWLEVSGSEIVSAQGWLATAERGPAYPVVSARTAYEEFVRTPHPMPMIACPEPAPQDGDQRLMCGGPVVVTGAEFGLSVQSSDDGPVLVPSWLFSVQGSSAPVVQVAVEPRLVTQGAPDRGPGMTQGTATAKPPVPASSVAPDSTTPAR